MQTFSRIVRLLLFAISLLCVPLEAQQIAGDWNGTLKAGAVELRLALHVKAEGAGFTGSLDSVDQGANDIQLSQIKLDGSKLSFEVPAVSGNYDGTINGDTITGTWSQGQPLPLEFHRGPLAKVERKPGKPSDIDGAWIGALDTSFGGLRVVLHLTNLEDGLAATLDSPDQNAKGIPATVTRDGNTLKFEVKSLGAAFEGQIDAQKQAIDGTFTQLGKSSPLKLARTKDGATLERQRPQNPVPPYPYRDEDVAFDNPQAPSVRLAATLTIPPGKGSFPAVVLITGSGPQDRDESLMGHKPFLVLADALTRKGIAVLRADDRGTAKSTGNFSKATSADFATDAEAGVTFLKTRPEVNARKIGLIGHSEGGIIAPMVAARNPDVAFIVMLAGSGVPGDQIILAQQKLILKAFGASDEQIQRTSKEESEVLALVKKSSLSDAELHKIVRDKLAAAGQTGMSEAGAGQLASPWFRYFLSYDPAPALTKVKCPVLVLSGSLDLQVPPSQNLPAIRKALEEGHNHDYEIDELPGLNHLFQTAKTGSPAEYAAIDETMSPKVLDLIASWILKHS